MTSVKTGAVAKTTKLDTSKSEKQVAKVRQTVVGTALVPTQKSAKAHKEEAKASSSKSTPSKAEENVGLSAEMTSLEKRLLGLDKAKTVAKAKDSKLNSFSLAANLEKV